ncbi:MAG: hypothetical protein DMF59_05730 [Acidobacteria bacterium]|nr:MAG: hypothetical protein DMF59_05730 [Acidobacteriota bacterium]
MYCPSCGVKNEDDKGECFVCGKRLPSSLLVDIPGSPQSNRPKSGKARAATSSDSNAARLGDRLIALILDTMFISAIVLVVAAAVLSRWPTVLDSHSNLTLVAVSAGIVLVIAFIYHWLQEGAFGATMGKAIIGVHVTRQGGLKPGLGPSAIRNAFRLLDALPFYVIGFFVALFSRGRRRLGDYAAGTFVLERAAVPVGERIAVIFLWLAGITAAVWGAWLLRPTWFQFPPK